MSEHPHPNPPSTAETAHIGDPFDPRTADLFGVAASLREAMVKPNDHAMVMLNRFAFIPWLSFKSDDPTRTYLIVGKPQLRVGQKVTVLVTGGRMSLRLLGAACRMPTNLHWLANALTWVADSHPSRRHGDMPEGVIVNRYNGGVVRVAIANGSDHDAREPSRYP